MYALLCCVFFGMTTIVGIELKFRNYRKIDVPVETLRGLVEQKVFDLDFVSPLYYYGVSTPYTKATTALIVVSLMLLSAAEYVLIAEDVLLLIFFFFPSLLKVNSCIVRHCVLSVMFIIISSIYFNLSYTKEIEKSFDTLHLVLCALVVWECVSVSWNYTTYRLLVNIRTMGTAASPVITYDQHISVFLHFIWRYLVPAVLLVAVVLGFSSKTIMIEFSWTTLTTSFICTLPVLYAIKTASCCWYKNDILSSIFRTTDRWGPLSIQHKKIAQYDEKAARIIG